MTNYEWLLQMGGEERQAWFDAQHVDANDVLSAENDVIADDACANDTCDALKLMREFCIKDILDALGIDRREKNHTRKMVQALADMIERDYVSRQYFKAQHRTLCVVRKQRDEREEQIAELTAQLYELTAECDALKAECDALADDLRDCNREREEYRELLSKAITHAHEIVNLQP